MQRERNRHSRAGAVAFAVYSNVKMVCVPGHTVKNPGSIKTRTGLLHQGAEPVSAVGQAYSSAGNGRIAIAGGEIDRPGYPDPGKSGGIGDFPLDDDLGRGIPQVKADHFFAGRHPKYSQHQPDHTSHMKRLYHATTVLNST